MHVSLSISPVAEKHRSFLAVCKKQWPVLIALVLCSCHYGNNQQSEKPLTDSAKRLPENALRGLKVTDGLEATLFAIEPMLTNPTNIDIDARGRVWVCEAFNYRNQSNPGNPYRKEGDRILVLEDTDGDGKADKQTVFYQGTDINAPLGICVLGNKVIVSCSPNVYVFTDTNGDDKADTKEVMFTGIGGVQHDHGIHAFNFGPDGKYYFNFGNAGDGIMDRNRQTIRDEDGDIVNNTGHPYRQGMVFRCDPDGSNFEVMGHNFRNNYEVAEDSYGTMWQSDNDDDGNRGVRINYVMAYGNYGYTDEMTGASWRSWRINMSDSIPLRHWHLNDPGVVPNLLQTGAGSPTGILVYEGDLLPERFRNQLIHADAGPNVVRSYAITKDGAGYKATINNIVQGTDDNWFRPSDVCIAPDGSLFIADWYDPGVGGHRMGDPYRGRIYRIAPPGKRYKVPSLKLDDPEDAVKALESPNNDVRYLAWQQLHAWGTTAVPALEKMYHDRNPRFRARALWLLSKLPSAGNGYIQQALKDKDEDIRITAIRAAEELKEDMATVVQQVVNDPSAQVRREAAIALRHCSSPTAAGLWAQLAEQYDGKDRWYLEALGIGADRQWDVYFAAWLQQVGPEWNTPAGRDIVWRSRAAAALPLLSKIVSDPADDPDQYLKFFRAFDFHQEPQKQQVLLALLEGKHPRQIRINSLVLTLLDANKVHMTAALKKIIDNSLDSLRGTREYIDIVRRYQLKDKNPGLLEIMKTSEDPNILTEAANTLLDAGGAPLIATALREKDTVSEKVIGVLGRFEDKKSKDILQEIVLDKSYPRDLHVKAVKAFGHGWTGEDRLLAIVKAGKLPEDEQQAAAAILSKANRPEIRDSAAKYLKTTVSSQHAVASVAEMMTFTGDAHKGAPLFSNYCSTCHQVNGTGTDFGPNLSEIGSKLSKEALYTAVIEPSSGISFGFDGYLFKLKDGSSRLGYITSETNDELTIKMIGGATEALKKTEITQKQPYGQSLMPSTLAASMSHQQLADLVEYLTTLKKKNQ